MPLKINIETIPHAQHRYVTVGDYWVDEMGVIQVRVSELSDWRREVLIAVHELVELLICKHDGVSNESIDAFDKNFEASRHPNNTDEPGDEPDAPYCEAHCISTGIERLLAARLGVKWKLYEKELNELP